MSVSDDLLCLFTARVREQDGSFVIEVPQREVELGDVEAGGTYRVALLSAVTGAESPTAGEPASASASASEPERRDGFPEPPVEEGETRDVEIENIGDQGDGIARVGPGYVVIVPDTDRGERVTVEITDVRENVAFAEVIERQDRFG